MSYYYSDPFMGKQPRPDPRKREEMDRADAEHSLGSKIVTLAESCFGAMMSINAALQGKKEEWLESRSAKQLARESMNDAIDAAMEAIRTLEDRAPELFKFVKESVARRFDEEPPA